MKGKKLSSKSTEPRGKNPEQLHVEEQEELQAEASATIGTLTALRPGGIITKSELARMLGKHYQSIGRAVDRGELPPPVHFCGVPAWTTDSILRHLESRLQEKAREKAIQEEREKDDPTKW